MTRPLISIVVPAYNEAAEIVRSLRALAAHLEAHGSAWEIIVVDDGSTDDTGAISAHVLGGNQSIRIERLPKNRGKGAAIRHGFRLAAGKYVAFIDADLPFGLVCIEEAVEKLASGADLAIGARDNAGPGPQLGYAPMRRLFSAGFGLLVKRAFSLGILDTQCGFKMFRADVGKALFEGISTERFAFDVELLILAQHWGLRVNLIPVTPKRSAKSSVRLVRDFTAVSGDLFRIWWRLGRNQLPGRPCPLPFDCTAATGQRSDLPSSSPSRTE